MRKFFKIVGLLLVLALMAAGGVYVLLTERADDQRMADIYAEVETLAREKDELTRERDNLQAEMALQVRDYSTFEIIFPEMRDEIYTQAYPIMRDHGVVGVLGINYSQLPGGEGNKLTVEQVQRLISEGWGMCICVDSYLGSFDNFYKDFSVYVQQFNIPVPKAIYFPNLKYYDPEMTDSMIAAGIETVIFDGVDGRTNTVTDTSGPLWTTYAMPWNYTGSSADFELLGRTDGGNQVYVLRFSEYWDKNRNFKQEESKEATAFKSLLEAWDKEKWIYVDNLLEGMETLDSSLYLYSGSANLDADTLHDLYLEQLTPEQQLLLPRVRSVNFERALDYHQSAAEKSEELKAQQEEKIAEIDRQIADLNAKIEAVYASYEGSSQIDISSLKIGSLDIGSLVPGQQKEGGNS